MVSSAIRKIEKGKQFTRTLSNFVLPNSLNICSVILDRETTFLTLLRLRAFGAQPPSELACELFVARV